MRWPSAAQAWRGCSTRRLRMRAKALEDHRVLAREVRLPRLQWRNRTAGAVAPFAAASPAQAWLAMILARRSSPTTNRSIARALRSRAKASRSAPRRSPIGSAPASSHSIPCSPSHRDIYSPPSARMSTTPPCRCLPTRRPARVGRGPTSSTIDLSAARISFAHTFAIVEGAQLSDPPEPRRNAVGY